MQIHMCLYIDIIKVFKVVQLHIYIYIYITTFAYIHYYLNICECMFK